MVEITAQNPTDEPAIERLLDDAFGPGRRARPSYRLRECVDPAAGLGFVARDGGRLVGTVRFWPVAFGDTAALLLGPLAVDAACRHRAIASSLIARGLEEAQEAGHRIVTAVGDLALFGRFGFIRAAPRGLAMPGLDDSERFLAQELVPGALDGVAGNVISIPPGIPSGSPRLSRPGNRR